MARPHDPAHHGAHTTGHPGRVLVHVFDGLVSFALCIPFKAFNQGFQHVARQCILLGHMGQSVVFQKGLRLAAVDAIKSLPQLQQCVFAGLAFIHQIISHTTKRIQRHCGVAHPFRQQFGGGKKTFRATSHHVDASLQILVFQIS